MKNEQDRAQDNCPVMGEIIHDKYKISHLNTIIHYQCRLDLQDELEKLWSTTYTIPAAL